MRNDTIEILNKIFQIPKLDKIAVEKSFRTDYAVGITHSIRIGKPVFQLLPSDIAIEWRSLPDPRPDCNGNLYLMSSPRDLQKILRTWWGRLSSISSLVDSCFYNLALFLSEEHHDERNYKPILDRMLLGCFYNYITEDSIIAYYFPEKVCPVFVPYDILNSDVAFIQKYPQVKKDFTNLIFEYKTETLRLFKEIILNDMPERQSLIENIISADLMSG